MDHSIFLAKIIGPYCIIAALGIFFNRDIYQKMMEDFSNDAALLYLGGAIALLIGFLVVLTHNIWVAGWPVMITIFGWLGIIKGSWLFIFPDTVAGYIEAYQKKPILLFLHVLVILAIGLFLTFAGYLEL